MRARRVALLLIRWVVGLAFVVYGTVKIAGYQFIYTHDWTVSGQMTDGTTLVWVFFGYSPVYGRLIGLAELVPAVLLLIPRTATLGALILLPIIANITVMDFCFGFPEVKYTALLLTSLCLVLVAADRHKLRRALSVILSSDRDRRPGAAGPFEAPHESD
jgi:uncharacterized membrane protein YphA (DoxX/SURF4 family)